MAQTAGCGRRCEDTHPTRPLLATGSAGDSFIRWWDEDLRQQSQLDGHFLGTITADWEPGGKWLASGGNFGRVRRWTPEGQLLDENNEASGKINTLKHDPGGKWLLASSSDGTVRVDCADPLELALVNLPLSNGSVLSLGRSGHVLHGKLAEHGDRLLAIGERAYGTLGQMSLGELTAGLESQAPPPAMDLRE